MLMGVLKFGFGWDVLIGIWKWTHHLTLRHLSSSGPVAHTVAVDSFQLPLFLATCLALFQDLQPNSFLSFSTVLLHIVLGRPIFLCPSGFHTYTNFQSKSHGKFKCNELHLVLPLWNVRWELTSCTKLQRLPKFRECNLVDFKETQKSLEMKLCFLKS